MCSLGSTWDQVEINFPVGWWVVIQKNYGTPMAMVKYGWKTLKSC
jgi:hypothetical protein